MGRYGVQISQQGIDINQASDYQKVLDSNWKFLDILDEVDIDITVTPSGIPNGFVATPIYRHNLGYLTGFEFRPNSLCKGLNTTLVYQYNGLVKADTKNIYLTFVYTGTQSIRLVGKLRVYNINITEEYQAPNIPETTSTISPTSRYGAKFIDLNRGVSDIEDESMFPFTMNTRGKQLSIHKHGTVSPANGSSMVLPVTHNIGYPPSYMIAQINNKSDWASSTIYPYPYGDEPAIINALSQSYLVAMLSNTDITFRAVQTAFTTKHAYLILKDPAGISL